MEICLSSASFIIARFPSGMSSAKTIPSLVTAQLAQVRGRKCDSTQASPLPSTG